MTTRIPWVRNPDGTPGEVWNPVRGCSPVSAGCANCYAARFASRFSGPGQPYDGLAQGGKWTEVIRLCPDVLGKPFHWKKPRMIFVNSMSDLFHDNVSWSYRDKVLRVIHKTPQHTYVILTKRPRTMREYMAINPCHLDNLWLGVSVEDQTAADVRIPLLLATPAALRFVSIEPQLGRVFIRKDWGGGRDRPGIDWIICGCESGPGRRPFDWDWARALREQCVLAGIPFFFKQAQTTKRRVIEMPALDGRVWDQIPERVVP